MEASSRWLRQKKRELNEQDKSIIDNLRRQSRCMHRVLLSATAYSYCGKPGTSPGNTGIFLCPSHRRQ